MPYRNVLAGDTVFIRATVLEANEDLCKVVIEDIGNMLAITTFAPSSEVAKFADLDRLKPVRREPSMWHLER
jgi:hypothetical protein